MSKPILLAKSAFDSKYITSFDYIYQGNQQFSSKLIITDSTTSQIVYQDIQTTFKLTHTLSANILSNGKSYFAEVVVYDINNNASEVSDKLFFRTFTTPTFYISNLTNNQIVRGSTYSLMVVYEQIEGELLNEYQIVLYDLSHDVISTSGYLYPNNSMSYVLHALLDNQKYYLKLTGTTVNKMLIELPEIEFSVEYVNPSIYSKILLENLNGQATIKVQSNLVLIEGKANHEPVIYIDGDKVDLRKDGDYIEFDEGFNIDNDFGIQMIIEDIPINTTFFELSDQSDTNRIYMQKWYGKFADYNEPKEYFVLHATDGILTYRTVSNYIDITSPSDQIIITVRRIDNLYSIVARHANTYNLDGGNSEAEYIVKLDYDIDAGQADSNYNEETDFYVDGGSDI